MPSAASDVLLLLSNDALIAQTPWRDLAVAGAALLDLEAAGRLSITIDRASILGGSPTGSPAYDATLTQLHHLGPADPEQTVLTLRRGIGKIVQDAMAQLEVARWHKASKGLFGSKVVWQLLRPEEREQTRARLWSAIQDGSTEDEHLRAVIAAIRGVRAGGVALNMAPREFHCQAGHVVHERRWSGVIVADALENARAFVERQMRIEQLQAEQAAAEAARRHWH